LADRSDQASNNPMNSCESFHSNRAAHTSSERQLNSSSLDCPRIGRPDLREEIRVAAASSTSRLVARRPGASRKMVASAQVRRLSSSLPLPRQWSGYLVGDVVVLHLGMLDRECREGVRSNAYQYVVAAARNRENQLRPPSPLCPVVTRHSLLQLSLVLPVPKEALHGTRSRRAAVRMKDLVPRLTTLQAMSEGWCSSRAASVLAV
jgi:hypothetical protein